VQVAGRAVHALFRIEGIAHPHRARRGRNQLHRPHRAGGRDAVRLSARFYEHDGPEQPAGQMMFALGAREQGSGQRRICDDRAARAVPRVGPQRFDLVPEVEGGQRKDRATPHPGDREVDETDREQDRQQHPMPPPRQLQEPRQPAPPARLQPARQMRPHLLEAANPSSVPDRSRVCLVENLAASGVAAYRRIGRKCHDSSPNSQGASMVVDRRCIDYNCGIGERMSAQTELRAYVCLHLLQGDRNHRVYVQSRSHDDKRMWQRQRIALQW
jgi:hypothetical protein